jgi:predicted nucleotidyltransferase
MGRGTIKRELDKLSDVGLITAKKQGNQIHYQANDHHPIFQELKSMIKKSFGVVGILTEALEDILLGVEYAFVYGSVAKGEEHAASDIDVLLVSEDLSYTELMEALGLAEQQLGRSINPTLLSSRELTDRIDQKQSFITSILSQDVLWLKGESAFIQKFKGHF